MYQLKLTRPEVYHIFNFLFENYFRQLEIAFSKSNKSLQDTANFNVLNTNIFVKYSQSGISFFLSNVKFKIFEMISSEELQQMSQRLSSEPFNKTVSMVSLDNMPGEGQMLQTPTTAMLHRL